MLEADWKRAAASGAGEPEAAAVVCAKALIGADGPTGGFFDEAGPAAW
ncbi:hypothetical protein ACFYQ5_22660 [Streptomyces sp. NPDC005794]